MSAEKLYEAVIEKKAIFPLMIFTDPYKGKHSGAKFMCFIGAYFPSTLFNASDEKHQEGLAYMRSGKWKADHLEIDNSKKIGYGIADSPAEAFRMACKMSGHLNVVQT